LDRVRTFQTLSSSVVTPDIHVFILTGQDRLSAQTGFGASSSLDQDRYFEVLAGDVSHDSASARNIQLALRSPDNFYTFIGRWTAILSGLIPGQPSGYEPIFGSYLATSLVAAERMPLVQRSIILPPAWQLAFLGNTAGAAYAINISLLTIVHPLAELPFFP